MCAAEDPIVALLDSGAFFVTPREYSLPGEDLLTEAEWTEISSSGMPGAVFEFAAQRWKTCGPSNVLRWLDELGPRAERAALAFMDAHLAVVKGLRLAAEGCLCLESNPAWRLRPFAQEQVEILKEQMRSSAAAPRGRKRTAKNRGAVAHDNREPAEERQRAAFGMLAAHVLFQGVSLSYVVRGSDDALGNSEASNWLESCRLLDNFAQDR
jgi:hypothetical protein